MKLRMSAHPYSVLLLSPTLITSGKIEPTLVYVWADTPKNAILEAQAEYIHGVEMRALMVLYGHQIDLGKLSKPSSTKTLRTRNLR